MCTSPIFKTYLLFYHHGRKKKMFHNIIKLESSFLLWQKTLNNKNENRHLGSIACEQRGLRRGTSFLFRFHTYLDDITIYFDFVRIFMSITNNYVTGVTSCQNIYYRFESPPCTHTDYYNYKILCLNSHNNNTYLSTYGVDN